ncbi:MAG: amidohydrolase family protein [Planctomycetes bacterium]|nr:amidohydrolase family protein [Planctomycetota bacterium]MCC7396607.1 amidohydrolase family protein [Planctomycetota bacterium]
MPRFSLNLSLRFVSLLLLSPGFVSGGSLLAQDTPTVYRGARILPGGSRPIENGVLIVAGGKILAVGQAALPNPDGATVVDCSGKTITPGLIDAAFRPGTSPNDLNEQSEEVTPSVRVLDTLDPEDAALVRARDSGVTTVHVMPGTRNVIGGLGCVVKTAGKEPAAMLVKADASLRIVLGAEPSLGNRAIRGGDVDSIYYRRPTTRMGVVWAVRNAFYDAKAALQQSQGVAPTPPNPGLAVLQQVLQGQLTAVTTARSEQDLRTALRLAGEFGYQTVIDEAQDAYMVADELAAAKVAVMLGAPSAASIAGTGAADSADPRFATVRVLAQKGVPFVVTTGTNQLALELVREAMFAVRNGLSATQALDAVTIEPAKLLGIADRVGSLTAGRDADFVIWSRDPLDPAAVAESVHIDGHTVTPAPR